MLYAEWSEEEKMNHKHKIIIELDNKMFAKLKGSLLEGKVEDEIGNEKNTNYCVRCGSASKSSGSEFSLV